MIHKLLSFAPRDSPRRSLPPTFLLLFPSSSARMEQPLPRNCSTSKEEVKEGSKENQDKGALAGLGFPTPHRRVKGKGKRKKEKKEVGWTENLRLAKLLCL